MFVKNVWSNLVLSLIASHEIKKKLKMNIILRSSGEQRSLNVSSD